MLSNFTTLSFFNIYLVTPTIQIVGESVIVHPDTRRVLAAIEGLYEEIQCVIFNAILPLNVTWLQNGISKRTESFLDVTKLEIKNLTSNFTFQMSVDAQILTCKVDGPFVEKQESYLYINSLKSGTPEDTSGGSFLYEFQLNTVPVHNSIALLNIIDTTFYLFPIVSDNILLVSSFKSSLKFEPAPFILI